MNLNTFQHYIIDGFQFWVFVFRNPTVLSCIHFRLPKNLRDGNWLLDYMSGRLKTDPGTAELGAWLDDTPFAVLKQIPRNLIPKYFDAIITKLYCKLLDRTW